MLDGYQEFRQDGWRGVARRGLEMPRARLDEWLPLLKSSPKWTHASRSISIVERAGRRWYVKRMWGLGDHPKAPLAALKWWLRSSRALAVWRTANDLEAAGVGCAPVLLAARRRDWRRLGWPEEVVVMGGVPGVKLRDALLAAAGDEARRRAVLEAVLSGLAAFHRKGFSHGDCNLENLFWEEEAGRVHFIDNDRTARMAPGALAGVRRNLLQLGFHLQNRELLTAAQWEWCFRRYAGLAGWEDAQAEAEQARNAAGIAERLVREPPRPFPARFAIPVVNPRDTLTAEGSHA